MSRPSRSTLAIWGEWSDAGRSDSDLAPIACIRGVSDIVKTKSRCASLTPRIGRLPNGSDGLELDLRGCERLLLGTRFAIEEADVSETAAEAEWPGLAAALHRWIASDTMRDGAGPRVGVGPSRTVAWLAANELEPLGRAWRAVAPTQLEAFLGPLPLAVLGSVPSAADLPDVDAVLDALAHGGVRTVGHLIRLPPLALRRRFGPVGAALALLAAGRDLVPLQAIVPDSWLGAKLPCDPPLATEHVAGALLPLTQRVAAALAERRLAAWEIALILQPESGPARQAKRSLAHAITTASALLGQAHLLLGHLLEPGSAYMQAPPGETDGAVDWGGAHNIREAPEAFAVVRLRVGALRLAVPDQTRLWAVEPQRDRRARLDRLLASLAGQPASTQPAAGLLRAVSRDPHAVLPEERYTFEPLSDGLSAVKS